MLGATVKRRPPHSGQFDKLEFMGENEIKEPDYFTIANNAATLVIPYA